MSKRFRAWYESYASRRAAAARRRSRKYPSRLFEPKRAVVVALGAALSLGGVSQAFEDVHFLVQKDLDKVQVVRERGEEQKVIARVGDGFAANSIYKIARAFPDTLVSERADLFDTSWTGSRGEMATIHRDLTLISDSIRREFFTSSIPFGGTIHENAEKYDVDPALVAAVMETESRFRTRARSQAGARGLMQLMPKTGRWMGARNLYDPDQNIEAGTKYLSYLSQRFDGDTTKVIAAYNAGEGTVKRYNGVPPYRETRTYVKRVLKNYQKRNQQLHEYGRTNVEDGVELPPQGKLAVR